MVKVRPAPSVVDKRRVRELKGEGLDRAIAPGPVVYWMHREQRVRDNWALCYALEIARKTASPVAVCFTVQPWTRDLPGKRQPAFALEGLKSVPEKVGG